MRTLLTMMGIAGLSILVFFNQCALVSASSDQDIFRDGSEYDHDSKYQNDMKDIKQYNKDGNNYIIVESKQESVIDKVSNFADKLFNAAEGYDSNNYKDSSYYEHDRYNHDYVDDDSTVTVYIVLEKNFKYVPDIRVSADGKSKIVEGSDF